MLPTKTGNNDMKIGTILNIAILCGMSLMPVEVMARAQSMKTHGLTSQPIGHYNFCKSNPGECSQRSGKTRPMQLTREAWRQMIDINQRVNMAIEPRTDMELFGVEEYWAYPQSVGDCEDYVLLKRRLLMQEGYSPSDLLITVVRQPDGSGHAVLTVRTDNGDFILDNMRNQVLLWSDTEYTFLKRQSSRHTGKWTKIEHSRTTIVGSIKDR